MLCIRTLDLKRLNRPRLPALFFGVGAAKKAIEFLLLFSNLVAWLVYLKSKLRDYYAKSLIEADAQRDAPALFRAAEPPRTR